MPLPKKWIALLFALALVGFADYFGAFKSLSVWFRATRNIEDWRGAQAMREAPGFFSMLAAPTFERRLYWIDNDTLLYPGRDAPSGIGETSKLRAWNWRTNAVSDIDVLDKTFNDQFCYADGFITYASPGSTPNEVIIKAGPLHKVIEQRFLREDPALHVDRRDRGVQQLNPFTCHWYLASDLGPEGRCVYPLREGDGFVDFSGRNCRPEIQARRREINKLSGNYLLSARQQLDDELARVPAVWYRKPGDVPVEMGVDSGELPFNARGIRFAPWSHSYIVVALEPKLLRRESSNWPKGAPHSIYSFAPGGRMISKDMPYLEMNQGQIVTAVSSRAGLVIVNDQSFVGTLEGRGAYLLQGLKLVRVIAGHIDAIAVSPDGCQLGVVTRVTTADKGFRVSQTDLCK